MIAHVNFQMKMPVVKFDLPNLVFDFENYIEGPKQQKLKIESFQAKDSDINYFLNHTY